MLGILRELEKAHLKPTKPSGGGSAVKTRAASRPPLPPGGGRMGPGSSTRISPADAVLKHASAHQAAAAAVRGGGGGQGGGTPSERLLRLAAVHAPKCAQCAAGLLCLSFNCCSMGCLPLQHPRDEWYAKAEETLGPDTITLVRKIRTLQVGVWAWPDVVWCGLVVANSCTAVHSTAIATSSLSR